MIWPATLTVATVLPKVRNRGDRCFDNSWIRWRIGASGPYSARWRSTAVLWLRSSAPRTSSRSTASRVLSTRTSSAWQAVHTRRPVRTVLHVRLPHTGRRHVMHWPIEYVPHEQSGVGPMSASTSWYSLPHGVMMCATGGPGSPRRPGPGVPTGIGEVHSQKPGAMTSRELPPQFGQGIERMLQRPAAAQQ
jgi:hypothetical protein